jgi:hypothetical protein
MTKRKLVQLGIIGCLVLILGIGGYLGWRKIAIKADVLPNPLNLTATLPGAADDILYNHWAFKYVDAVIKDGTIMPIYNKTDCQEGGVCEFRPNYTISRDQIAVYAVRIKGIATCPHPQCEQTFSDVPPSHWAYPYIEAAYRAGLLSGVASDPYEPAETVQVLDIRRVLRNCGYSSATTVNPPGLPSDITNTSDLTRVVTAAYIAYNMNLAGDDPFAAVYLQWDFPEDPNAGFDFGYEVWRHSTGEAEATLLYVQDPPEEGLEEGSDFGMFYDKTVEGGKTYTYYVKIFNRAGDYSAPAQVTIGTLALPSAAAAPGSSKKSPSKSPSKSPLKGKQRQR